MDKNMLLSPAAKEILTNAVVVGSWHVLASTIVPIAELISAGFIAAEDGYEGPRLGPTKAGRAHALAAQLVREGEGGFHAIQT